MPNPSDGDQRPSFLTKFIERQRRESYKSYLRALTREELQATRDVYAQPIDGNADSPSYEGWITEDTSRDPQALEVLDMLKTELARRNFLESKGVAAEPGILRRTLMGPRTSRER